VAELKVEREAISRLATVWPELTHCPVAQRSEIPWLAAESRDRPHLDHAMTGDQPDPVAAAHRLSAHPEPAGDTQCIRDPASPLTDSLAIRSSPRTRLNASSRRPS